MQPTPPKSGTQDPGRKYQPLRDLPTPPELAAAIDEWHRYFRARTAKEKLRIEEELKLQYYFGGQDVMCLKTHEGRVVIASGVPGEGDLGRVLESLSPDERRRVSVIPLDPWDDGSMSCPTVFFDET
jgi:hypothetical protein